MSVKRSASDLLTDIAEGPRICNDKSGYPRPYPAQVASGVHWAGVVNAYAEYNPNLSYAYSDVYNAAAVNAVIESLKERIAALEAKITTE